MRYALRMVAREAGVSEKQVNAMASPGWPDTRGRFGPYGIVYVPETLVTPLEELERAYTAARADDSFRRELDSMLRNFAGRPTPLQFAERLTQHLGGPRIYIKREDLLHTGSHKINNCLGQGLLAVRMGKRRIIAETGAVSTALPRPRLPHASDSNAWSTWALKICSGRR